VDKFGRSYVLEVETQSGVVVIGPPITIEMHIIRNTQGAQQSSVLRVYNLSEKRRSQIRFNIYDYGTIRNVRLRAGYGTNMASIFRGNIMQAFSVREGVNFITQIESYDGGYAYVNGTTAQQFPAGTPQKTVVSSLMATLPYTSVGVVGSFPGVLSRGNSYSGNTTEILNELTGGAFFIDQGKAHALGTNEYIAAVGGTTLVNAASGLLGTPMREVQIVRFDMVFEPGLNPGHKIKLQSLTEANFNRDYKVTSVEHHGIISEAVCGELITTGVFNYYDNFVAVV